MIKDAKYMAEQKKITHELMTEAVKLQKKHKLLEQEQRDKVTFKFEFIGIKPGDTQKLYLKFNSPALSLALMNNKAKGGSIQYSYLNNFIQMARQSLQTQTGINPLQFEKMKSSMGDLVFSTNNEIDKGDLTQLLQIQPIPVVVKVITGEVTQPTETPQQPDQVPQKNVVQPTPSITQPTAQTATSEPIK